MNAYKHILLALDLSPDSEPVAQRAADLARRYDARLSMTHVVEYIPVDPSGEALLPAPVTVEKELIDNARQKLEELAGRLGVPKNACHVTSGSIRREICRLAKDDDVDLIVLGRHERHGLAVLLGSPDDAIIHRAPCDVLSVHLNSEPK
ncbi:MAG TPA: universal stress protein [Gammaproteobacteria bacterium]|nr:universal stress protein [Gammaproteobacteria bacterium]